MIQQMTRAEESICWPAIRIRVRAAARAPALHADPRGESPVAPLRGEGGPDLRGKAARVFFEDSVWKDVPLYSTLRGEWQAMCANRLPTLDRRD
jgi:hypothetical protein